MTGGNGCCHKITTVSMKKNLIILLLMILPLRALAGGISLYDLRVEGQIGRAHV